MHRLFAVTRSKITSVGRQCDATVTPSSLAQHLMAITVAVAVAVSGVARLSGTRGVTNIGRGVPPLPPY